MLILVIDKKDDESVHVCDEIGFLTQIKIRSGTWLSCNDCEFITPDRDLDASAAFVKDPYNAPFCDFDDKYLGKSR